MEAIEEIFPQFDQVPRAISATLQEMVYCYLEAVEKKQKLDTHMKKSHLFEIRDGQGTLFCLYKKYVLEEFAKKDVAVYLLDHSPLGHRSTSSALLGLSRVPPTVFIRTKDGFGCLVKFLDCHDTVAHLLYEIGLTLKTLPEEIQKVCITHIRFGCMDAHAGNTLVTRDESGTDRLTVIDNEECLTQYKLGELWWSNRKEADEDFTSEMVKYVTQLNVDKDISFLKKAGWEVPSQIVLRFRVFTQFLKLAVEFQLKPKDIGLLATGRYKKYPGLNLLDMVNASDRKNGDDAFIKSVQTNMVEGLKEFVLKVYKHRVDQKPKK